MYGYGFKPFWFWNGDMSDAEIKRQIHEMNDKGVDGFYIHPRQGMALPYLSKLMFDKIGVAVECAEKFDMEVWLYDEYAYPSGIAGGEVLLGHPEYKARALKIIKTDVCGEVSINFPWGKILNLCACPVVDGKVNYSERTDLREFAGIAYSNKIYQDAPMFYNKKRYFSSDAVWRLEWNCEQEHRIYACVETEVNSFKYFGTFIDPINPGAIDSFINMTHERYKKHLGHHFGKTIKGIFADETSPWGAGLKWSPLLPELFEKEKKYSLVEYLPALIDDIGGETAKIRYDYNEVLTDAFIINFDKKLNDWCESNNLVYTCEKPILRSHQLKYQGIPGVDTGHEKVGDKPPIAAPGYRACAKVISSAAHFYKKPRALVEAYHSEGWDLTIQDMKWNIDVLGALGVDMFVPHAFYYSTDGLRKHDAPPSQFFQNPYWKYMGQLSSYMKNMLSNLTGHRNVRTLVLDPVYAFWSASGREDEKHQRDFMEKVQYKLALNQIDFYIVDARLLCESHIDNKRIAIDGEPFDVLVVPSSAALKANGDIDRFVQKYMIAGGQAILFDTNSPIEPQLDDMCSIIKSILPDSVRLETAKEFTERTLLTHYTKDGTDIFFVVNTSKDEFDAKIAFNDDMVELRFTPFQSYLLKYCSNTWFDITDGDEKHVSLEDITEIKLPDEGWHINPLTKNALRLYNWILTIENCNGAVYTAEVVSKPIINQALDHKLPIVPRLISEFGCSPKLGFPAVKCRYEAKFNVEYKCAMHFVMEPGSISGEFDIQINGSSIKDRLAQQEFYSATNIAAEITDFIREGENEIIVYVDTQEQYDGLIDPLYIFGDFGVESGVISAPQSDGKIGEPHAVRLPYYAGDIEYSTAIQITDEQKVRFTLPWHKALCAGKLIVNGVEVGVRTFSPFEWVVGDDVLKDGDNEIKVIVTTSLLGLLEGERIDKLTREVIRV